LAVSTNTQSPCTLVVVCPLCLWWVIVWSLFTLKVIQKGNKRSLFPYAYVQELWMFLSFTMNLDHMMDQDIEQFPSHHSHSHMMPPAASEDIVRWQSSQPTCPALEALLVESLASERGVCEFLIIFSSETHCIPNNRFSTTRNPVVSVQFFCIFSTPFWSLV
jgi:hypothetical protein